MSRIMYCIFMAQAWQQLASCITCSSDIQFVPHSSCFIAHASQLLFNSSCLTAHALQLMPHSSCLVAHVTWLMPHNLALIAYAARAS